MYSAYGTAWNCFIYICRYIRRGWRITIDAPANSPVPPGAKPVKLADSVAGKPFAFTEGATSDKAGNVYFIDQPNDRILKWTFDDDATPDNPKGKISVFLTPSGYSNGMSFDADDNLVSCADEKNQLWLIHAPFPAAQADKAFTPDDLKIDVLIKDIGGKLMNGPNDVWIVPTGAPNAGAMYLTDPLYSRTWWGAVRPKNDRQIQQPGRYVWLLTPDKKLTPVITDFRQPNGIVGTPDGKTLYVSDIDGNQTWQYTINADGTLADKKLFCPTGSDGMTIDNDGNVYTTHGRGMMIWDKNGNKLDQFNIQTSNICFGGKNRDILFINGYREVYTLKVKTHGVGPS